VQVPSFRNDTTPDVPTVQTAVVEEVTDLAPSPVADTIGVKEPPTPADHTATGETPITVTGVNRSVVVLSPNCLKPLAPQHFTEPSDTDAHECESPVAIETEPERPDTETGVNRSVVVLSPNWPDQLAPQHFTEPPATSTQVWSPLAEIATAPDRPDTETGVNEFVVEPLPN
jgi:hypothetical protein